MTVFSWSSSVGGNFNTQGDWTPTGLPGSSDQADIALASAQEYTISLYDAEDPGSVLLDSANAYLWVLSTGTLTTNTFTLQSGTFDVEGQVNGGTIISEGGTLESFQTGTLSATTWHGPLQLTAEQTYLTITNSLTVLDITGAHSGEIDVTGDSASLIFATGMTLNGTGQVGDPGLLVNIGGAGTSDYIGVATAQTLTIGAHATISETAANSQVYLNSAGASTGTQITNDGLIVINEAGSPGSGMSITPAVFVNAGSISDLDGSFGVSVPTVADGGSFSNSGTISTGSGGDASFFAGGDTLTNSGVMNVAGGTLQLEANTIGGGTISISSSGTAEVNDVIGTVKFLDATGYLQISNIGSNFDAPISGFREANNSSTYDTIELTNSLANTIGGYTVTAAGGALTLDVGTSPVETLELVGDYRNATFSIQNNGAQLPSAFITTNFTSCFLAGARILTERGEVAVENLCAGDYAVTLLGRGAVCKPIRWIGYSRIDLDRHPTPQTVAPIRILAGAFGDDLPRRDLLLSPDHAVHFDGVLIPIHDLVNGATVRREAITGVITYYHVELDAHDVLVANGLPTESYLDTGNRADFENGGGVRTLHPEFRATAWRERACAPQVTDGAALEAVRARLVQRAATLGFVATDDPGFAIVVDDITISTERSGAYVWRCMLPSGVRSLRLTSRNFIPDERNPGAGDARRLGIPLLTIRWDGVAIALDDPALVAGFHPAEAQWRWTDGDALVRFTSTSPPRRVEIELLQMACPYWAEPVAERRVGQARLAV